MTTSRQLPGFQESVDLPYSSMVSRNVIFDDLPPFEDSKTDEGPLAEMRPREDGPEARRRRAPGQNIAAEPPRASSLVI
jgi:hypothetical protein